VFECPIPPSYPGPNAAPAKLEGTPVDFQTKLKISPYLMVHMINCGANPLQPSSKDKLLVFLRNGRHRLVHSIMRASYLILERLIFSRYSQIHYSIQGGSRCLIWPVFPVSRARFLGTVFFHATISCHAVQMASARIPSRELVTQPDALEHEKSTSKFSPKASGTSSNEKTHYKGYVGLTTMPREDDLPLPTSSMHCNI
jgi:hypothetical protein